MRHSVFRNIGCWLQVNSCQSVLLVDSVK